MIVYLKNHEIDREQWDNCIRASQSSRPYAFSWYLDIMAPGWEALVDDDYDSVFPLPRFKKYGIQYIATPIFLQQLGAFSPDNPADKVINEFIDYMPEFYKLIDLCVAQKVNHKDFKVTERPSFELNLSSPYEVLFENFNRNCKRNISGSLKHKPEITENITPAELIRLFLINKGSELKSIKKQDYQRLENLMNFCIKNKKGRIVGVKSKRNRLIFGLFYIEFKSRKTMILLVNTPESHEKKIGFYVYNELIRESAGSHKIFDFAGSSIPSVATFMESFGSVNNPYYRIYNNKLPWPVSLFK
jgi:hypothetical protein